MINIILSISVSILSIVALLFVIIKYHCIAGGEGLIGASWILGTLGTPMTFLCLVVAKIGLSKSLILQYRWVTFFYLLQYQLIAFFIYKGIIDITTKKGIICLIGIVIIIIISANIMWRIIMGPMGH